MTLALDHLYDAVTARFTAEFASPPLQVFGWREPAKRAGAMPRIVWVPGDDESGDLGTWLPARNPGRNPRPLATIGELVTVYFEAVDLTAPEDERAQYRAARLLYDAWLRAVYLAAHGTFVVVAHRWEKERSTRRYGATIRAVLSIQSMVPDVIQASFDTSVRGINTSLLEPDDIIDAPEVDTVGAPVPTVAVVSLIPQILEGEHSGLTAGDRVLLSAQTAPATNGVYVVAVGAWARASDTLTYKYFVRSLADSSGWELQTPDPIVVGTTPLEFVRISP